MLNTPAFTHAVYTATLHVSKHLPSSIPIHLSYFLYFLALSSLFYAVSPFLLLYETSTISTECHKHRDKCMVIAVASGMVTGLVAAGEAVDH